MFKIVDKKILVTRGDIGCINVTGKKQGSLEKYGFKANDILHFKVMKKGKCDDVVLFKQIIIPDPTEMVKIYLTSDDTKIGGIISKPTTYWYEITLNPDTEAQTILGFDDVTGAKEFILYPEGGDVNE